MITAADYSEWARFAGLYLDNHSHAHRYKTYQEQISASGVVVRVVDDFLKDNKGGIDIPSWRSYSVYEMAGDAQYRLNLTADALAAIGATRAAAKVRTAQDTSPSALLMENMGDFEGFLKSMQEGGAAAMMEDLQKNIARAMPGMAGDLGLPLPGDEPVAEADDCETFEEIERLLNTFVASHQTALQNDYARHGDPRTEPDFDPDARLEELDGIRGAEVQVEVQNDQAETLQEHLTQFEKTLRGRGKRKATSWRRKILSIYRRFSVQDESTLTPAMTSALSATRRVMNEHPDLFFPQAIDDEELTQRLAGIGEYNVDPAGQAMDVSWNHPPGLEGELGQYALRISFVKGDRDQLQKLLDRADRLIADFETIQQQIRAQILESFANYRDFMADWELEDYETDAEGNVTEASILSHAGAGTFNLTLPDWDESGDVWTELYAGVDWDDEHGLQMEFE